MFWADLDIDDAYNGPPFVLVIDSGEQTVPEITPENCPRCGTDSTEFESGYGLAGGGCGVYTACNTCGLIVSKRQDDG